MVGRPYERRRRRRRTFAVTRRPRYLLPVEGGHGSVPRTANDDEASGPVIDAPRRQEPIASGGESLIIRLGRWLFWVSPSWRQLEAQSEQFARSPTCSTRSPDRPTGQNLAVRFPASELKLATNRRYGFSFQYPVSWERQDPTNGDGLRAIGLEAGLEVLAYGALPFGGEFRRRCIRSTRLSGTRVRRPAWYTRRRGPSQQNITRILPGGNTSEVAGSRFVTETEASDGQPALTSVVLLTTTSERDTMRCQVPARLYSSYRGACNQLLSSLTLTR